MLLANALPLNADTTPTVTETSISTPSDLQPRPPVDRIKDGEAGKARVPLQNVTNVTPLGTESSEAETGSERKRKVVSCEFIIPSLIIELLRFRLVLLEVVGGCEMSA